MKTAKKELESPIDQLDQLIAKFRAIREEVAQLRQQLATSQTEKQELERLLYQRDIRIAAAGDSHYPKVHPL